MMVGTSCQYSDKKAKIGNSLQDPRTIAIKLTAYERNEEKVTLVLPGL